VRTELRAGGEWTSNTSRDWVTLTCERSLVLRMGVMLCLYPIPCLSSPCFGRVDSSIHCVDDFLGSFECGGRIEPFGTMHIPLPLEGETDLPTA
jgi:hypothetical protein